jgi:hypothetical protein
LGDFVLFFGLVARLATQAAKPMKQYAFMRTIISRDNAQSLGKSRQFLTLLVVLFEENHPKRLIQAQISLVQLFQPISFKAGQPSPTDDLSSFLTCL